MQSLTLHSRVNSDGVLRLEVPLEANLKVAVIIKPEISPTTTPDKLGYPPRFFREVAGGWAGEPLAREQLPFSYL